jgi:hypothetical protein
VRRKPAILIRTAFALLASCGTLGVRPAPAEPLDPAVPGPKLICFKYSTFALLKGERITEFTAGAEAMSLVVETRQGAFEVGESEIFASPKRKRLAARSRGETKVFAVPGKEPQYAIYGRTSFSPNVSRPVIMLSGSGLIGSGRDRGIYARFLVRDPRSARCDERFGYSW